MKIYRSLAKSSYKPDIQYPATTQRMPSNVPFFVDNIWEWLRPEHFPSRRTSVYASPAAELAAKYANANDLIATIEFAGSYSAVQLTDFQDARFHPDVKKLPATFRKNVGQAWLDADIADKKALGALFIPVLSQNEVNGIMLNYPEIADTLRSTSTFWKDCKLITETSILTDGEVFFSAEDGYRLVQYG